MRSRTIKCLVFGWTVSLDNQTHSPLGVFHSILSLVLVANESVHPISLTPTAMPSSVRYSLKKLGGECLYLSAGIKPKDLKGEFESQTLPSYTITERYMISIESFPKQMLSTYFWRIGPTAATKLKQKAKQKHNSNGCIGFSTNVQLGLPFEIF